MVAAICSKLDRRRMWLAVKYTRETYVQQLAHYSDYAPQLGTDLPPFSSYDVFVQIESAKASVHQKVSFNIDKKRRRSYRASSVIS